jgi:hypothetical protein
MKINGLLMEDLPMQDMNEPSSDLPSASLTAAA